MIHSETTPQPQGVALPLLCFFLSAGVSAIVLVLAWRGLQARAPLPDYTIQSQTTRMLAAIPILAGIGLMVPALRWIYGPTGRRGPAVNIVVGAWFATGFCAVIGTTFLIEFFNGYADPTAHRIVASIVGYRDYPHPRGFRRMLLVRDASGPVREVLWGLNPLPPRPVSGYCLSAETGAGSLGWVWIGSTRIIPCPRSISRRSASSAPSRNR